MSDEDAFLARIASTPADDLPRLVYADWLEEQGTEEAIRKAEFLRVQHAARTTPHNHKAKLLVQMFHAMLPVAWLRVVSYLPIENCEASLENDGRIPLPPVRFEYECPRDWAALQATDDSRVRFCGACQKNVYFCATVAAAQGHARQGHCVAVHAGESRSDGDLERGRPVMMGAVYSDSDFIYQWLRADSLVRREDQEGGSAKRGES